jgi:nucleotide-binding universal stress UspA family protein
MYKKILIPVDGSVQAGQAVQQGVALAQKFGAEVVVFHVVPPIPAIVDFDYTDDLKQKLAEQRRDMLADYQRRYRTDQVDIKTDIASGAAAESICEKAEEEGFDLVVIGSRGLSPSRRILLGSVSDRVSRNCHCPVLIVR